MRDYNQQIIKFDYSPNFKDDDFYISKSNENAFKILNLWPNWEKNYLNISGEKFSGKTHLINIFLKKFKGIKIDSRFLNNEFINEIKIHQNIIVENLDKSIDEKLLYTLMNIVDQDNKYLIITSKTPLIEMQFLLNDLASRAKNCLLAEIAKPDDELIFALILKNFSDRQITLDKKLIDYIVKRIDRSYSKIKEFIYKVDEMSLKQKKPINLKTIKELL